MPIPDRPIKSAVFKVTGSLNFGTIEDLGLGIKTFIGEAAKFIVLDLKDVNFCKPSGIAALAATIEFLRMRGHVLQDVIRPRRSDVDQYLSRIDLYKALNSPDEISFKRHDSSGRFVELTTLPSMAECQEAAAKVVNVCGEQLRLPVNSRKGIEFVVAEITENIFHHSNSAVGYLCCQCYRDHIAIAIVDLGIGIEAAMNLNPVLRPLISEKGALQAAIEPKATGRPAFNSGWGLFWTSKFVEQNRGVLGLYSHDLRLMQQGKFIRHSSTPTWPGTIVHLLLNRNNELNIQPLLDKYSPLPDYDDPLRELLP